MQCKKPICKASDCIASTGLSCGINMGVSTAQKTPGRKKMACAFGVPKIWAILRVTKIYCYNIFDRTKEKKQHIFLLCIFEWWKYMDQRNRHITQVFVMCYTNLLWQIARISFTGSIKGVLLGIWSKIASLTFFCRLFSTTDRIWNNGHNTHYSATGVRL